MLLAELELDERDVTGGELDLIPRDDFALQVANDPLHAEAAGQRRSRDIERRQPPATRNLIDPLERGLTLAAGFVPGPA